LIWGFPPAGSLAPSALFWKHSYMAEDINFFNLDVEFNVVDEILGDPLLVERPRYPNLVKRVYE
jgi:hypothetical protein